MIAEVLKVYLDTGEQFAMHGRYGSVLITAVFSKLAGSSL